MKKRIICFCVIILVIIFAIFLLEIEKSYSKYAKNIDIKSVSGIARPCFLLKKQEILEIKNLNTDIIYYEFFVKNFENNFISETSFLYNISFEFSQDKAPIKLELYKIINSEERKVEIANNSTILPERLGVGEEQAEYKLKVYYNLESNEIMINDLEIKIIINAVQEEESN